MAESNDGGAAFPFSYVHPDTRAVQGETGMSLRDYFAAQALTGAFAAGTLKDNFKAGFSAEVVYASLAKDSYEVADAMLAERAKAR